jgi:hypothetical protein
VIGRAQAEELLRLDTPESKKLTFRHCFAQTRRLRAALPAIQDYQTRGDMEAEN